MNPEQLMTLDCLGIYRHLDRQTRQRVHQQIMKLFIILFSSSLLILAL